ERDSSSRSLAAVPGAEPAVAGPGLALGLLSRRPRRRRRACGRRPERSGRPGAPRDRRPFGRGPAATPRRPARHPRLTPHAKMRGASFATVVMVRAMRTRGWIIPAAALLAASVAAGSSAQPSGDPTPRAEGSGEPVVVELFTAQGRAGCPEATTRVEALADTPGVIALTYAVDYWDYLGWADTFARPEFTQRQRAYRRPLKLRAVGTPQVVIDGRRQVPGAEEAALKAAVEE